MSDAQPVQSQVGQWAMVPVWVLTKGLTGAELAVYVALRSYADRNRECYPTVADVALRAGVHVKTAEKSITRLRDLDLIRTTRRYDDKGSIIGCRYWLRDLDPEAQEEPAWREPLPLHGGNPSRSTAGARTDHRTDQENSNYRAHPRAWDR